MREVLKKCAAAYKKDVVLWTAVLLALCSCFAVPPSAAYLSYVDWDTLALLFSLMAVMGLLKKAGFFGYTANLLLKRIRSTRSLLLILCLLPFVFSMVITNDVAVLTFVPFGFIALKMANQERLAVPMVLLQTVAANVGSMLTPMGNPQNLYLYNRSGMGVGELCGLMLPYVLAAGACLLLITAFIKPVPIPPVSLSAQLAGPATLWFCAVGIVLCFLGVFKVLSPLVVAAVVGLALLIRDRKALRAVDYSLLGTFLAFFVFVGNLSGIEGFRQFLASVLEGHVELVAALTSQVISNVPAALLLSGFTSQWKSLLIGCNFGGLGTLIASMVSLIAYKLLAREYPQQRGRYLGWFTLLNLGLLFVLFGLYALLGAGA